MRGDPAPFRFDGDQRGILCIHGFTGTPFEMRYLGEQLARRGFTVRGPALPGHTTSPEALDRTSWRDWYAGVERAFDDLREQCRSVAVVGQSLGGLLALELARVRGDQVAAIASLAAPLWLGGPARALIRACRAFPRLVDVLPAVPKLGGGSDVRDPRMKLRNPSYPVIPLRALLQLDDLMRVVRGRLGHVRAPALIVHGRADHTAPYACSQELARKLGSRVVRHRALHGSFHLVAVDIERDVVAAEVGRFFADHVT